MILVFQVLNIFAKCRRGLSWTFNKVGDINFATFCLRGRLRVPQMCLPLKTISSWETTLVKFKLSAAATWPPARNGRHQRCHKCFLPVKNIPWKAIPVKFMLAAAAAIICVLYNLFPPGKLLIVKRKMTFLRKYCNSVNGLRKLFADAANLECNMLAIWVVTFVRKYFVCMFVCLLACLLVCLCFISAAYYWRIKLLKSCLELPREKKTIHREKLPNSNARSVSDS